MALARRHRQDKNGLCDAIPCARRDSRHGQGLLGRQYPFARREFSDSGVRAGAKGYWRLAPDPHFQDSILSYGRQGVEDYAARVYAMRE